MSLISPDVVSKPEAGGVASGLGSLPTPGGEIRISAASIGNHPALENLAVPPPAEIPAPAVDAVPTGRLVGKSEEELKAIRDNAATTAEGMRAQHAAQRVEDSSTTSSQKSIEEANRITPPGEGSASSGASDESVASKPDLFTRRTDEMATDTVAADTTTGSEKDDTSGAAASPAGEVDDGKAASAGGKTAETTDATTVTDAPSEKAESDAASAGGAAPSAENKGTPGEDATKSGENQARGPWYRAASRRVQGGVGHLLGGRGNGASGGVGEAASPITAEALQASAAAVTVDTGNGVSGASVEPGLGSNVLDAASSPVGESGTPAANGSGEKTEPGLAATVGPTGPLGEVDPNASVSTGGVTEAGAQRYGPGGTPSSENATSAAADQAEAGTSAAETTDGTAAADIPSDEAASATSQPTEGNVVVPPSPNGERIFGTMSSDSSARGRQEAAEREGRRIPTQAEVDAAKIRFYNLSQDTGRTIVERGDMDPSTGKPFTDPEKAEEYRQAELARQREIANEPTPLPNETAENAGEGEDAPVETRSIDEIREQQIRELEDIGTQFFESFLNGNTEQAEALSQQFNERLAEHQSLTVSEANAKQLREFVGKVMKPENAGNQRETAKMRALKEKLIELSRLELMIRSVKAQAEDLNKRIKDSQDDAAKAENAYYNESDKNSDEKQRKLLIFQGHAMRVQSLIDVKDSLKTRWLKNTIDRRIVLGKIHRQIGSKTLLTNLLWGAKTLGQEAVFGGVKFVNYPRTLFA